MCGRFELKADKKYLEKIYKKGKKRLNPEFDPNIILKQENIAPTNKIMVIVLEDGEYKLKVMKWAIRSKIFDPSKIGKPDVEPFIEKDIFNNRIETIKKSPQWKSLIYNNRCLVPMTAFYEWPVIKGEKIPQRIFIEDDDLFFAGGIFKTSDLKNQTGVSILTCEPNKFMKPIHNRMPVLFQQKIADDFLIAPMEAAIEMCEPLDNKVNMSMHIAEI